MSVEAERDVTALLNRLRSGDARAGDALLPMVERELHRLAQRFLRDQRAGHTLQTTALVNEAWLRLAGKGSHSFADRAHFLAVAARAMRSVLVDHARRSGAMKRGAGAGAMVPLDSAEIPVEDRLPVLLAIDDALGELGRIDPQLARIVELRFFGGLTIDETAAALAISTPTVERGFATAKAWLAVTLGE